MNKDIQALATQLYSPLFAERDNIRDAYDEAMKVAMQTKNPAVATVLHVLMNSIAVEIEKRNNTPLARVVVATGERHVDPEATEEETTRCPGL
jgi:NAD-dependent DNA ligase